MIHQVLPFLAKEINTFFKLKYDLNEDKVVLSNIVNPDGSLAIEEQNKVLLTMINVEEETTVRQGKAYIRSKNGSFSAVAPPVKVNLMLLFSAYFENKNYVEAMKFLSGIIAFFQSHKNFTPQEYPALNGAVDRMLFEIVNLDINKLNNMWGVTGSKYIPSIAYRLKTIQIMEVGVSEEIGQVKGFG